MAPETAVLSADSLERRVRALPGERFLAQPTAVMHAMRESRADVPWLGHGGTLYGLVPLRWLAGRPVVVDTDSVWSWYVLRQLEVTEEPGDRRKIAFSGNAKRLQEVIGTNLGDLTTAVSEVDMRYFRRLAIRKSRIGCFPNVIDIEAYEGAVPLGHGCAVQPAICYTGTFHSAANRDAAHWLLDEIMPRVWETLPDVHVYVVGRGATQEMLARMSRNVTVTGEISSTIPYIQSASVMVVPLRFESGTRFKILEAFASRTPVVSTTLGAKGLDVRHREHLLIADASASIASSILEVLGDAEHARILATRGKELVVARYSLRVAEACAQRLLQRLAASQPARVRVRRPS